MINIGEKFNKMVLQELRRLAKRDKHGWKSGQFRRFRTLQASNRGRLGENFIVWFLEQSGRKATCTRRTDPTNKQWDIRVDSDNITLEVKTATLGYSKSTFQHEAFEKDRQCDGMVFLDIAPNAIYITCLCKHTFKWKEKSHHRRYGVHHKIVWTLKQLEEGGHKIRNIADFKRHYLAMLEEILKWRKKQRNKPE